MEIIRGFASITGYKCSQCNFKCCATEYNLPLTLSEWTDLQTRYPVSSIFLRSSGSSYWLSRGDGCPFLLKDGLCLLYATEYLPIICKTYPMTFWKVRDEQVLVWINPCRGGGFDWVTKRSNRIVDLDIQKMIEKIYPHFDRYWGEQINGENPFEQIKVERVDNELKFFENLTRSNLLTEMQSECIKEIPEKIITNLLIMDFEEGHVDCKLMDIINSVLHWLSWSPTGLSLNFINAKLLFVVASTWIIDSIRSLTPSAVSSFSNERLFQQLGSSLATAILPSFWENIYEKSSNSEVKELSKKAVLILKGEIPQQSLL